MAKFCTKCGKPLKDGEICSCQMTGQEAPQFGEESFSQDAVFSQESSFGGDSVFQENPAFGEEPVFGQEASAYQQEKPVYQQEAPYQKGTAPQQGGGNGAGAQQNAGYQQQNTNQSYYQENYERNVPPSEGLFQSLNGISRTLGGFLDAIYNVVTPTDKPGRINNMVPVRKLLGFSKEDRIAQVGDCYERGMQIVPDLIQPCGQEIPIRQYDLCTTRSLLKGTWQEGKLQVTNKRVLFRLSGRNWVGRSQKSIEFALDDVVGIEIKNGNRLSFVSMMLNSIVVALFATIGQGFAGISATLALILGLILSFGLIVLLKKHYYAKAMAFAFTLPAAGLMLEDNGGKILMYISGIVIALFMVYYLLASIRPNLSFKVLTKSGSASPIEEKRVDTVLTMLFNYFIARGMDVLPGKDAERAMDEVGTMIMDIQKFGDFGIQKWKQN